LELFVEYPQCMEMTFFFLENACAYYEYRIQNRSNYLDFLKTHWISCFDIKEFKNENGHTFVRKFTCLSLNPCQKRKYPWKFGNLTWIWPEWKLNLNIENATVFGIYIIHTCIFINKCHFYALEVWN
jgi:hypothetical protein